MKKSAIIIIILILGIFLNANAQKTMLIKGTIVDKSSNKPIETELNLKSESGKKYRVNSNEDGTYSNGIEAGDTYFISIRGYLIPTTERTITIPKTEVYKEFNRDLHILKFASGMELYSENIFKQGTSILADNAQSYLTDLREDLVFHNVKVNFIISTCDYFNKNKKARASATKQLMSDRIKVLKDICFKLNFRASNVDYLEDIVINAKPQKSPKDQFKVVVR